MPQLGIGSMDQVKTGLEVMPAEKKVRVKVIKPEKPEDEARLNEKGTCKMLSFALERVDGEFKGRRVYWKTVIPMSQEVYLGWKLKDAGRELTTQEKTEMWERKDYLRDIKRFADACGVDTSNDLDTNDLYGKELWINITQEPHYETGEPVNEAKAPRKIKE